MCTGILLYLVLSIILVFIAKEYQMKHPNTTKSNILSLIILFSILISSVILVVLPYGISQKSAIGDNGQYIHNISNFGTLYYDPFTSEYFIIKSNDWDLFHMHNRIGIDYELGKSIHDAKNTVTDLSEYIVSTVN